MDIAARRFPVTGPSKPDGAWTFTTVDSSQALAIFSGKMGTARQMTEALNTAAEYKKSIGKIEPVAEAFAVTYPEGKEKFALYALESYWHAFHSYSLNSLKDVAETIKSILTLRLPPPEHSEAMMIRLLRSAVRQISAAFSRNAIANLVEVFGKDNPLFASILPVGKTSVTSENDAREAAGYLLVNQLLFYHILSSYDELKLPKIDPTTVEPLLVHPSYFKQVLEIDYKPVFEFDIAQNLSQQNGTRALRALVHAFEHAQAHEISSDVIGKIFHNLIPLQKRKPVAAYYTNSNAAHLLAHLAVDLESDKIIDPACGSGTILVSAYQVKRELYEKAGKSMSIDIHERFVGEQITGIDIMPFSGHLAVVNLSLQAPEHRLQKVRVAIHDSLELKPGAIVESSRSMFFRASMFGTRRIDAYIQDAPRTLEEGAIQGDFTLDRVDVVLMNPPFSDSDRIPKSYKADIAGRFKNSETTDLLQGKYSLQLPFLLLAHDLLVEGGRIGAVLPVTTFTGEAFLPWMRYLLHNYTIRAIIVGFGRTAFSENTALSECLFVAEKNAPPRDSSFVVVGVEISPPDWNRDLIHTIAQIIRDKREESVPGTYLSKLVDQSRLDPTVDGLQAIVGRLQPGMGDAQKRLEAILRTNGIAFGELEKTAQLRFQVDALSTKEQEGPHGRGLEFYCAPALAYFVSESSAAKRTDRLIIEGKDGVDFVVGDKITGVTFRIPISKTIPMARRISGIKKLDSSDELDFVASSHFKGLDRIIEHVIGTTPDLLKGTTLTNPKSVFLHRIKTRWPKRIAQGRARAWMARKIDLTASGSSLMASYSEERPMIGGNMWLISCPEQHEWIERALVLWFNSSLFLSQLMSFRTETRGSWGRIDKHRMLPSIVPAFTKFSPAQKLKLEQLFGRVKKVELPSIKEQLATHDATRREIDSFFLEFLAPEMKPADRSEFLNELCSGILARFERMLRAM